MRTEEKIQKEIRRRAFDRAELYKQADAGRRYTRFTIGALEEVTGLPRVELEAIAAGVRASHGKVEEGFFSIKNQLLIAAMTIAPALMLIGLVLVLSLRTV